MYIRHRNKILSKGRISEVFNNAFEAIKRTIENESENYILNANVIDYSEHLESNYRLNIPELHFKEVNASSYEDNVPADFFPTSYDVYEGKSYKMEIIQFFIPCSGDINLLNYRPANIISMGGGGNFEIKGDSIVAEFINFSNNADKIKRDYQNEENGLHANYKYLIADITSFNNQLKSHISSTFNQRKERILSKNNLLSNLGVPIRKTENLSKTFSVPNPQLKEKIIVKPTVTEKGFKPEPSLGNDDYRKILKIINDVGKNFERMPSLYKDKGEEDLRDHIIMVLDPNFELGSVSGETFNKTGKTDIQLRYDSSVVFIAECKFWSGSKNYLSTIDQLLGYLTWRDNKASVIIFVKQKDFISILDKVGNETLKHPNCLGFVSKTDENWFNYRFHINGDRNREIQLAVQVYNIPQTT